MALPIAPLEKSMPLAQTPNKKKKSDQSPTPIPGGRRMKSNNCTFFLLVPFNNTLNLNLKSQLMIAYFIVINQNYLDNQRTVKYKTLQVDRNPPLKYRANLYF